MFFEIFFGRLVSVDGMDLPELASRSIEPPKAIHVVVGWYRRQKHAPRLVGAAVALVVTDCTT